MSYLSLVHKDRHVKRLLLAAALAFAVPLGVSAQTPPPLQCNQCGPGSANRGYGAFWMLTVPPGVNTYTETSNITYGTNFNANTNGLITDLAFYKPSIDPTTSRNVTLWTSGGTSLAVCTTSNEPVGVTQWIDCPLVPPYSAVAGSAYVVSYDNYPGTVVFYINGGCQQAVNPPGLSCVQTYADSSGLGFPTTVGPTVFADVVFSQRP